MITYEYDQRTIKNVERKLGLFKEEAPKVLKNAINQTAKDARKDLAKEAQKTYTVKVGGFNKHMKLTSATQSRLEAILRAQGEHVEMQKFSISGKVNGKSLSVTINRKNGKKTLYGKYFYNNIADANQIRKRDTAKGKKGSKVRHLAIAARESKNRLPIHEKYSVAIPQMIGNERDVYGVVEPDIAQTLKDNVAKEVVKILNR